MSESTAVATINNVLDLPLAKDGTPVLKNLAHQQLYAEALLKTGMLPNSYKQSGQVIAGLQMATELGLKPGVKSLSRTAIINGNPSIWGELPLSICLASGQVDDWEGYHFDKDLKRICFENRNIDQPVFGYFFKVKRKGEQTYHEDYYTIQQAQTAGLFDKSHSVWKKHPEDMLKWRCIGKVLKVAFGDLLSGVPVAEYDHNTWATGEMEVVPSLNDSPEVSDVHSELDSSTDEIPDAEIVSPTPGEPAPGESAATSGAAAQAIKDVGEGSPSADNAPPKTIGAHLSQAADDLESQTRHPIPADQSSLSEPSEYVVPLGAHAGRKLGELSDEDCEKSHAGLSKHVKNNPKDRTAIEYLQALSLHLEERANEGGNLVT